MADKVAICNLAITRIAGARITALSDTSVEAKHCSAIFELIAEEVMALGPWPSVRKRAVLAQLVETPAYEFTYTYQLPTDPKCLKVLRINDSKTGDTEYAIEGTKLLTNESSVSIKYIAYITDSETYDIYLRQAIVDRLVAELTYVTTGQLSAYKASLQYAETHAVALLSASGVGAQSAEDINSDTFIDARGGSWPNEGRLRD